MRQRTCVALEWPLVGGTSPCSTKVMYCLCVRLWQVQVRGDICQVVLERVCWGPRACLLAARADNSQVVVRTELTGH